MAVTGTATRVTDRVTCARYRDMITSWVDTAMDEAEIVTGFRLERPAGS